MIAQALTPRHDFCHTTSYKFIPAVCRSWWCSCSFYKQSMWNRVARRRIESSRVESSRVRALYIARSYARKSHREASSLGSRTSCASRGYCGVAMRKNAINRRSNNDNGKKIIPRGRFPLSSFFFFFFMIPSIVFALFILSPSLSLFIMLYLVFETQIRQGHCVRLCFSPLNYGMRLHFYLEND